MSEPLTIGINGMGRIGRALFRQVWDSDRLTVAAVNDPANPASLPHFLTHDSLYGRWERTVAAQEGQLLVDGRPVRCLQESDWSRLPWGDAGVQVVVEASGATRYRETIQRHLNAGAQRVVVTANLSGADFTLMPGVNTEAYDPDRHKVLSASSCTTQALVAVFRALHPRFPIEGGHFTAVHPVGGDQPTVDRLQDHPRMGRGGLGAAIPIESTAGPGVGLLLPEFRDRVEGVVVRVPTATVTFMSLACTFARPVEFEDVLTRLKVESSALLRYSEAPLISADFCGDTHSAILDAPLCRAAGERQVGLALWFDNEAAYVKRLAELLEFLAR